jgi:RNA polymerase sigma factor (sigma-70 family)
MSLKENPVHRLIRTLVDRQREDRTSDRDLLRRFAARRDEEAFAALFRRHGAMVLGVAARVLGHQADAEDVRQATFLLLARKAGALTWRDSAAGWLYAAAYRLALQARQSARRRRQREAQVKAKPSRDPLADITLRDLQAVLDEELSRLPRKYSAVLILCCLEGKARDEAAGHLGLPVATVKSRLEAGREMLRARLARRGLTLSLVLAGVSLPSAGMARAASPPSANAMALFEEAMRSLSFVKCKIALASLAMCGLTLLAWGLRAPAESAAPAQQARSAPPTAGRQEDRPRAGGARRLLEPQPGQDVMAVKYSPTGEWMATAEIDGKVRLWDTRAQRPGPVLRGPGKMVRSLAFAPDGTAVIAGCGDGRIYVWDVPAGKLRTTLRGHRGDVCTVALTSDGKTLASYAVSYEQGRQAWRELKIWDLARSKCVRDIECRDDISGGSACDMVFAPGTRLLAVACYRPFHGTRVWDAATGKEDRRFPYGEGFPLALAISPDGKWLAAGGGNAIPISNTETRLSGSLRVWDWKSGRLERTLVEKADGYFRGVAFSRDGTRLVAGCQGPNVQRDSVIYASSLVSCWEVRRWRRLWATQGLYGDVWSLDIAPDGQSLTSSDTSGAALLDACLGRVSGWWLTTPQKVNLEDFGAERVLNRPHWPEGLAAAVNGKGRVYAHWANGTETFYYRGQPPAVNDTIRRYAAVKGDGRQLLLLPGPGRARTLRGKTVAFDWQIQARPAADRERARMTIYLGAPRPRPVDGPKVEQWLQDLDSASFRTREAASEELRKLGNNARPALRAALRSQPTLEVRRRIEQLLSRLPGFDLTDLEIPEGAALLDAGDVIAKGLEDLKRADPEVRRAAIEELSSLAHLSDKVVPALMEVFAKDEDPHLRQVAAACLADAGLAAKSAAPALKAGLNDADANVRHACEMALGRLAEVEDTPAERERVRRERAIARDIRAWKDARAGGR